MLANSGDIKPTQHDLVTSPRRQTPPTRCTMLTFSTIFKGAINPQIVSPNHIQIDIFALKQPLIHTICRSYKLLIRYACKLQYYIFLADVA